MDHTFNVLIATEFDVNTSIFIHNLAFWTHKNIANEKHFYEDRFWSYNTLNALTDLFPYWSIDQIRTIIKNCIKNGLMIKGNFNKSGYDRTQWFSLTDKALSFYPTIWEIYQMKLVAMCGISQMDSVDLPNGSGGIPTPIPDSKQQIVNTDSLSLSKSLSYSPCPENEEPTPQLKPIEYKETYFTLPEQSIGANLKSEEDNQIFNITDFDKQAFETFWDIYPLQRNKDRVRSTWFAEQCHLKANEIIEKLQLQIKKDKSFIEGYIMTPLRYILERGWENKIFELKQTNREQIAQNNLNSLDWINP